MPGTPLVRAAALATPFRPQFSPARVIARTLTLWKQHAMPFVAVTLVVHAPATIFVVARGQPTGQAGALDLVQIVLGNVLAFVTAGVLTSGALRAMRGEPPRARILLAVGARRLRRVVLAALAYGLITSVAMLALVIPGIVAVVGLFVAPAAAVVEPDLTPTGALRRSWSLTGGRRLEVFLVWLVTCVLSIALVWIASSLAREAGGPWWLGVAASELVAVLAASVFNAVPAVVYRDLRLEKDGVRAEDVVKVFE